jgi:N-methylhydantoinase B
VNAVPQADVAVDPISLGVIAGALGSIVKEMSVVIERTGRSPVVAVSHDFSNAVYANIDGVPEMISQGQDQPVHLGGMMQSVRSAAERFAGNLFPGDVIVGNDPAANGTHLPDVDLILPVFAGDRLIGWACSRAHHVDVGGPVPGGYNPAATDLMGEGIRIPPIKLVDRGVAREDVWELILANVRSAHLVRGDMAAQLSAVRTAGTRLEALWGKYGATLVERAMRELLNRAERLMRAEVAAMPDGVYAGESVIEDDGKGSGDMTFRCEIRVEGDHLWVRLESPPAVASYRNCYAGLTKGAVYFGILSALPPGIPINAGLYRAVSIDVGEPGTVLNAQLPAACAMSTADVWSTAFDAVCGATSAIVPERACAGWSRPSMLEIAGSDPRTGEHYSGLLVAAFQGGAGASHELDGGGLWGIISTAGAASTGDIELLEVRLPLHFHRHELSADSACPGRWRGAIGAALEFEAVDHDAVLTHVGDGVRLPSVSRLGGGSPRDGEVRVHRKQIRHASGEVEMIGLHTRKTLHGGERVECVIPGGGGIGRPGDRAVEAVVRDVEAGTVSAAAALEEYGVALADDLTVDAARTAELRAR